MADTVEILFVEDDPNDAELTSRALSKANLANRLHHVTDGEEALAYLGSAATRPRLVLLDIKLPKTDGLEVLRRIREEARTRTLPVVVLTSSREDPDIRRAYALGANSYIVKPVDFENFSQAVVQLGLYWLLLNQPPATAEGSVS